MFSVPHLASLLKAMPMLTNVNNMREIFGGKGQTSWADKLHSIYTMEKQPVYLQMTMAKVATVFTTLC